MIEVIGRDGRTHNFAEGTTQGQIDAALAALYNVPTEATSNSQYPDEPPRHHAQQSGPATSNFLMIGLGGAAIGLAILGGLYFLTRDKPPAIEAGPPQAQTTTPQNVIVAPTDALPQAAQTISPAVTVDAFSGFIATKQGGNVVVRAQPQATGAELAKLAHGAPVAVTGSVLMADGLWRQVSVGGGSGFVKGEYVSQTRPAAIARPVPVPVVKTKPMDFWGTVVTNKSSSVNMRANPTTGASVIVAVPAGAEVQVIGEQGDWYQVQWGGKRGWINTNFVEGYDD